MTTMRISHSECRLLRPARCSSRAISRFRSFMASSGLRGCRPRRTGAPPQANLRSKRLICNCAGRFPSAGPEFRRPPHVPGGGSGACRLSAGNMGVRPDGVRRGAVGAAECARKEDGRPEKCPGFCSIRSENAARSYLPAFAVCINIKSFAMKESIHSGRGSVRAVFAGLLGIVFFNDRLRRRGDEAGARGRTDGLPYRYAEGTGAFRAGRGSCGRSGAGRSSPRRKQRA